MHMGVVTRRLLGPALVTALVTAIAPWNAAFAQVQTQRGAVVGGLSGAAIGAIIGDNSDEAGAGAAIGGVIGAVAGGILGNADDRERYSFPPPTASQSVVTNVPIGAITTSDVISMTQSRVSDQVIITAIRNKGIACPIDVPDIVFLTQQGVSDLVIRAMQNAGTAPAVISQRSSGPYPVARPVIVEHFPPVYRHAHRPYPSRPPMHYQYRTSNRRHGSGWNISFGGRQ